MPQAKSDRQAKLVNKKVVVNSPDTLVSYKEGQPVIDPAEAAAKAYEEKHNLKPVKTSKPKLSDEEKEQIRLARENELAQKRAEAMIERADKAKKIQGELLEQLSNPCSLEQLQDILAHFAPQVRVAKSKKSGAYVASEGAILAKNGVVYKPKNEWKETHHLSNEEVLAIVAEANKQRAAGTLNKSAIGRMFNAHGAMISNILDGSYYSELTGIPKPEKGTNKA